MSLKRTGSTEVIKYGTWWGQLHWCLAGMVGLGAGTKCLLNCRNTKLVSLNSICVTIIQFKCKTLWKRLSWASQLQMGLKVNPTYPSVPWSSSAGHTYSCASKNYCSSEEQQNNDCCHGQAHDGDSPDLDAALFLGVTLCEETHCFICRKWSSMFECLLGILYLWLR